MSAPLYQLLHQFEELSNLDIDQETLADTMEALEGEIQVKAENILRVVANMGGDITAVDNEIKRLQARKMALTHRKDNLKDYLRVNMEKSEIKKISCPLFAITLVAGRAMVEIDSVDDLPEEYVKTQVTFKPVKADILKAMKDGTDVPGAHLITSKSQIRIK